jgi:3-deoxy-D-manno-octulosonate 8-phosphate phosphatase (KDO 8-P phosphatase)
MIHLRPDEFETRVERIKLVLMDCDGVLTDGRIMLLPDGDEQKTFHTRDGHGIVLLHRAGIKTGVISGRTSSLLERRARELGINFLRQGTWNKIKDFEEVLNEAEVSTEETAFIGDDVTDIPLMERVGFAVAVEDAVKETKDAAHYITSNKGGFGAVREVADMILKTQGRWVELMSRYISIGMDEIEFEQNVYLAFKHQISDKIKNDG